jgi:hypothetical protein
MSLGDPEGLRTQNKELLAQVERLQQRLVELGERSDLPPFTKAELEGYHKELLEAVRARDDDRWDSIFVGYMKDCLARERDDDPYACIAAFVRGSTKAAFDIGIKLGEKGEKLKRKRRQFR